MLYHYAAIYATNRPVPLKIRFPKRKPTDLVEFTEFCDKHNILDLYLWLANRFPKYFIEKENCLELKEYALKIIQSTLENSMLKHQYSHSQVFRSQRKRMHEAGASSTELPHTLSTETRNEMLEFLKKTPEDEWHVFPNESYSGEEEVVRGSRGGRYRGGSGHNSNGRDGRPSKRNDAHNNSDKKNSSNGPSHGSPEGKSGGNGNDGVGGKHRRAVRRTDKVSTPRAVRVVSEDRQRTTKSADGRKVQKWNN
jgi:hypothetical protein